MPKKFERCVKKVKKSSPDVDPYAVCTVSTGMTARGSKYNKPRNGRRRNQGVGEGGFQEAMRMNERFHGRPTREIMEAVENYHWVRNQAVLGQLIELVITRDYQKGIPIRFGEETNDNVSDDTRPLLTCDPQGQQLYVVDTKYSDQSFDPEELGIRDDERKHQFCIVGDIFSITYFADKHHLEGPKEEQARGTSYEHEFGEEGGHCPCLVYDYENRKVMIIGGTYKVESEGIRN